MPVRCLAINMGRDFRLLDHLAPFCYLMDMPFLVTEEKNKQLLEKFYPMISVLYEEYDEISYADLAKKYDVFFQSTFWDENLIRHFANLQNKEVLFVYCPHGNSDKGHREPMMKKIIEQDRTLLYGEHMIDLLKKQNLWDKIPPFVLTGNYRYTFYKKFQSFYDQKVKCLQINPEFLTILYAPTWNDREKSTSFYSVTEQLVKTLPDHINLIIKTHPLLEEREPALYWKNIPSQKKNLVVLEDFPPIHPLLNCVDLYLGDFSSIGYDFLKFEKPMFFFDLENRAQCPSCHLHQVGKTIPKDCINIYEFILKHLDHSSFLEKKKQMYHFAFGEPKSFNTLQKQVLETVQLRDHKNRCEIF